MAKTEKTDAELIAEHNAEIEKQAKAKQAAIDANLTNELRAVAAAKIVEEKRLAEAHAEDKKRAELTVKAKARAKAAADKEKAVAAAAAKALAAQAAKKVEEATVREPTGSVQREEFNNMAAKLRKLSVLAKQHWGSDGAIRWQIPVIVSCLFIAVSFLFAGDVTTYTQTDKAHWGTAVIRTDGTLDTAGSINTTGSITAIGGFYGTGVTNLVAGATLPAANGAALTNLAGGNIASGNIASARLTNAVLDGLTVTGTVTMATVAVTGGFTIDTNKFAVTDTSGNIYGAGTLIIGGAVTVSNLLSIVYTNAVPGIVAGFVTNGPTGMSVTPQWWRATLNGTNGYVPFFPSS